MVRNALQKFALQARDQQRQPQKTTAHTQVYTGTLFQNCVAHKAQWALSPKYNNHIAATGWLFPLKQ